MFYNNRVRKHTTSYLRWIINLAKQNPRFQRDAERAAVELVRRRAL